MPNQEFGTKLRELRKQANLSQRELAGRIGVNFTYLSKIESGVMPPPSEKVILRLAEVLNADKDELLTLAGKIPSDIAQMLKNREALQFLRSDRTQKKMGTAARKGRINIMKNLFNLKNLARVAVPIILVLAVAASLWFASPAPVKALNITFTNPSSGTIGSTYSFTVKIDIADIETIPIQTVNLEIYNTTTPLSYTATASGLPLGNGSSRVYSNAETGGGTISVTSSAPNWGYFSRTGYAIWQGTGYSFGPGYGYGYQTGAAALTYSITWTSPGSWPTGNYRAAVNIVATSPTLDKTFTSTSDYFTLSAGGGGGGGGTTPTPGGPIVIQPGLVDVTKVVNSEGVFTQTVNVQSDDTKVGILIAKDTIGKTKDGDPISRISAISMAEPPEPPKDANVISLTYNLGPDGATFAPPITLTFTYDPTKLPQGFNEKDLVISKYDDATGKWVELKGCVVDTAANTISVPLSGFSKYAIFARAVVTPPVEVPPPEATPAAFSVSTLMVKPAEVQPNVAVTITVLVANTGGTDGNYTLVLNINGVKEAEKSVTISAGGSQVASFSVSKAEVGSYSVTIDSLSGSFTVIAPAPVTLPPGEKEEAPGVPSAGLAWWVWLIIVLAGIIIIGVIVWIIRRRMA